MRESKEFIFGFSNTLDEIRQDVEKSITLHSAKKNQVMERAKALEPLLPEGWLRIYRIISNKKPAHGVFSRLEDAHCQFCRFSVSKTFESEVDTQLQLKSCPSCGRLFLPYKTVAG